jgi:hypothetical protein
MEALSGNWQFPVPPGHASQPSSGFPRFEEGDVQLILSVNRYYVLHSNVLRRNSAVFDHLLAPVATDTPSKPSGKRNQRKIHQLVLKTTPENRYGEWNLLVFEIDSLHHYSY